MPVVDQNPPIFPTPDPDPATGLMYDPVRGYLRDLYAPMDAGYVGPSEQDPTDSHRRRMYHGAGGQSRSFRDVLDNTNTPFGRAWMARGRMAAPAKPTSNVYPPTYTAEQEALKAPSVDPILAASYAAPGSFGPIMASKFLLQQIVANHLFPQLHSLNAGPLPARTDIMKYTDTGEAVRLRDIGDFLAFKNKQTPFGMHYRTLKGLRQYLGSRVADAAMNPDYENHPLIQGTAKVFSKLLNALPTIEQYTEKYAPTVEKYGADIE